MASIALVQFSTGAGSAEVAYRAVAGYDRAALLTANTLVEDHDNWRFAHQVWMDLGQPTWHVITDGRTPMQVGRDVKVVPNNRMAVCSRILKREAIRSFMEANYDPADCDVLLGFDWTEGHRFDNSVEPWKPWTIKAPLMEPPYVTKSQILDNLRAKGIEPPRLYAGGFSHANCGGGCVRGGQAAWRRLLFWDRDRYLEWEDEEEKSRAELGKDVAILRERSGPNEGQPLTLRAFRLRNEDGKLDLNFDPDDEGACGCFMEEAV